MKILLYLSEFEINVKMYVKDARYLLQTRMCLVENINNNHDKGYAHWIFLIINIMDNWLYKYFFGLYKIYNCIK